MPRTANKEPKPDWLKFRPAGGERYAFIQNRLKTLDLHTVCREALCPNMAECWGGGTATIMIMGDTCTRGCRFCAVKTGNPKGVLDESEPEHVAQAVAELELDYVVLTSVDRDDLPDGGAAHFAQTVSQIKTMPRDIKVEVLVPDFGGQRESLETLIQSHPEVIAHNLEVVECLTPLARDRRASYRRSLDVLRMIKEIDSQMLTKSSLMVGLGESLDELDATMHDLLEVHTDILTFGQYLRPSARHLPVERYYRPEEFEQLEARGRELGFRYVAAGPLVRSSYRAGELFVKGVLKNRDAATP